MHLSAAEAIAIRMSKVWQKTRPQIKAREIRSPSDVAMELRLAKLLPPSFPFKHQHEWAGKRQQNDHGERQPGIQHVDLVCKWYPERCQHVSLVSDEDASSNCPGETTYA